MGKKKFQMLLFDEQNIVFESIFYLFLYLIKKENACASKKSLLIKLTLSD